MRWRSVGLVSPFLLMIAADGSCVRLRPLKILTLIDEFTERGARDLRRPPDPRSRCHRSIGRREDRARHR